MNAETAPESQIQANATTATGSTGRPGPVHVWLVDDHAMLRTLIAQSLENHGGIVCTRQFDSPNSLLSALASRIGPDVILLDVQMGELNGLDAIPAIKSLSRSTRVLMLTTSYNGEWHQQALESGASGYLLKTDPLERLAGSICARDEAAAKGLMRAEPLKTNFRRRRSPCPEPPKTETPRAPRRSGFFRWIKGIAT